MAKSHVYLTHSEQEQTNFATKCEEFLRGMERQKLLAREMIETARTMCDRAQEMRKPPRQVFMR